MIEELKKDADVRMTQSIEALRHAFARLRAGRAHPDLLEQVSVDYYGAKTPLRQAANVTVGDPRTLIVAPWDKSMLAAIEKAIQEAGLGLNPMSAGTSIRVPLPPLNEERRRELARVVKNEGESARVAIRNIRRDVNGDLRTLCKEKEISEDEERRAQGEVQKITDHHIAAVDALVKAKEADLMDI